MTKKNIHIEYNAGNDYSDLDDAYKLLIDNTIEFANNAYAPYSNFKVSACLILNSGEIIKGTNVENASYPVSICAERTLLSHTVSNHPKAIIKTIAIFVDKDLPSPVPPCGLCRQTMLEIETRQNSPIEIILVSKNKNYIIIEKASDLLPLSFDGNFL